jgi:serine/threonine protein kinase
MPDRKDARIEDVRPPAPKPLASWYAQGVSDDIGDRLLMFDNSDAPSLELLRFHPHLAQTPGFEAALREEVQRLAHFQHPAFARIRAVQRLEPDDDLALISNYTPGKRLSEVLHRTRGPEFAAALIQQLAPALALFQQHASGASHGLIDPERIVVSPEGRLTIVEHVVGRAIEMLGDPQLSSSSVALPPGADGTSPRTDAAADWYQLGLVAASALLGKPVTQADLPEVKNVLDELDYTAGADGSSLSPFLRQWLARAFQISGERIEAGPDACAALEHLARTERSAPSRRIAPARRARVPRSTLTPVERHVEPASVSNAVPASVAPAMARVPQPIRDAAPAQREAPRSAQAPAQATARNISDHHHEAGRSVEHTPRTQPSAPANPLSLFEREARAANANLLEFRRGPVLDEQRTTAPRPHERNDEPRTFSLRVVAALAVVAVVEAGVIGWLARATWLAPTPAIVAESTASGENVIATGGAPKDVSLSIAVAPDLTWTRVISPSADKIFGAKPADTGAIRISAPIDLRVFEGTRLLGSTAGGDIKLSAGRHEIALVNTALGYRLVQMLDVEAGQTMSLHIAPPHGMVNIDASPWAEVSIDGRPAGRTPLGPLPLALGDHEITFRNPAGSSDRQRVVVKPDGVTRIVGNLRF